MNQLSTTSSHPSSASGRRPARSSTAASRRLSRHAASNPTARAVLELVRRVLPDDQRAEDPSLASRLSDLDIGSLRLLSLIMDLEERFELSIDALARIDASATLGEVIQLCTTAAEHSFDAELDQDQLG